MQSARIGQVCLGLNKPSHATTASDMEAMEETLGLVVVAKRVREWSWMLFAIAEDELVVGHTGWGETGMHPSNA